MIRIPIMIIITITIRMTMILTMINIAEMLWLKGDVQEGRCTRREM